MWIELYFKTINWPFDHLNSTNKSNLFGCKLILQGIINLVCLKTHNKDKFDFFLKIHNLLVAHARMIERLNLNLSWKFAVFLLAYKFSRSIFSNSLVFKVHELLNSSTHFFHAETRRCARFVYFCRIFWTLNELALVISF